MDKRKMGSTDLTREFLMLPSSKEAYLEYASLESPFTKLPCPPPSTEHTFAKVPVSMPASATKQPDKAKKARRHGITTEDIERAGRQAEGGSNRSKSGCDQAVRPKAMPRSRAPTPANTPVPINAKPTSPEYSQPTVTRASATTTAFTSGLSELLSEHKDTSPPCSLTHHINPQLSHHPQHKHKKLTDPPEAGPLNPQVTPRSTTKFPSLSSQPSKPTPTPQDLFVADDLACFADRELCEARSGDPDSDTTEDEEEFCDDFVEEQEECVDEEEEWHVVQDEFPDLNERELTGGCWELI